MSGSCFTRREFLGMGASCAAHLSLMAAGAPLIARSRWAGPGRFPVVAQDPWGRIESLGEGLWALVSTPLSGDRTTLCNGGIIAGRAGVLVIESFASDAGSRWMAAKARELTGRAPTHVVLTHYHGDHTGGIRGSTEEGGVRVLATEATRDRTAGGRGAPADILADVQLLDSPRPTEIDLGGRSVLVVPRRGHTASDVTLQVSDPSVVWCGDLVWNGMFPNYVDATPSRLAAAVRLMRREDDTTYVPGHGALADTEELDRYIELLDDVEAAARRALEAGMSAEDAGAAYEIPESLGEWTLFSPNYFARAIGRWMEELGQSP